MHFDMNSIFTLIVAIELALIYLRLGDIVGKK
jgi:hypothetical protein